MSLYINCHTLQTHAVNNINRDDAGEQKSCFYGGTKRARISSQSQKYYLRHSPLFKLLADKYGLEISVRTRELAELGTKLGIKAKDITKITGDGAVIAVGEKELKLLHKNKLEIGDVQIPLDVALFGRMFAQKQFRDYGACSISNAFTTNTIKAEFDWFSATDDLKSNQASAHLNAKSFSTGTYYKQLTINVDLLAENLGIAKETAVDLAVDVIIVALNTINYSNIANSDNFTSPTYTIIELSERPISYSNKFEKPTRNEDEAVERLAQAPLQTVNELQGIASILDIEIKHSVFTLSNRQEESEQESHATTIANIKTQGKTFL